MMSTEVRSRFVMANGVRTHYSEVGGNGPVIVASHGGGAGSSGEAGMAPLMRQLPADYRVIALDSVGGFGKTDIAAPAPYGLQSRVAHLADFVDALCLDRFTLLGNSQGAWVSARYAMSEPKRVERMILIGSGSIAGAMGFDMGQTEGLKAMMAYDNTREGMRTLLEGLVFDKNVITEQLIDLRFGAASRPGAMEAFKASSAANRYLASDPFMKTQYDMRASLPALTALLPTIMIWGENDTFAPAEFGRKIEPLLPAVTFHYVDHAGHQVQNDQPKLLARIITDFMTATPANQAAAA